MTIDRILAVVGIFLGLPGFLLLFFTGYRTEAILALGLGLTLFSSPIIVTWLLSLPPYSITEAKVALSFDKDSIQKATITKEYKIRPNQRHLTVLSLRNIAADGKVENLRWNGNLIPKEWLREVLGEYEVTIHFPGPHALWKEFSGALSYEVTDSFNGNPEGLVYAPDHPTKVAQIEVTFPNNRPCRSANAYRVEGAGQIPIAGPEIFESGLRLKATIKRPTPGTEYWFWWNW